MRRFIILCSILLVFLSALIYVWVVQSGAENTLVRYQRNAAFSPREMTYRSAVHPLFGDGVLLYQPTFPDLPIQLQADKLLLKSSSGEITLQLTGVKADFANTLLNRYGADLPTVFRQFQAPEDFLMKPVQALTLLKQDGFRGNISITLRPHGNDVLFRADVMTGHHPILQILGTISVPTHAVGRLWGWTSGQIQSLTVQIQDANLLRQAATYLRAVRQPLPESLTRALNTQTPLAFTVDLEQPVDVSSLFE